MTLIITAATPLYVLQVADRVVSVLDKHGCRPGDRTANKVLVYRTTDGVLTIGYTGLAYVDGMPTDEWLAGLLWGGELGRGPEGRAVLMRSGPRPNQWTYSYSVGRLRQAISEQIDLKYAFAVTIGGWRERKRDLVPVLMELRKDENSREVRCAAGAKRPLRELELSIVGAEGGGPILSRRLKAAVAEKRGGIEVLESILVDTIREVASRDSTVGPDITSVVLFPGGGGCRSIDQTPTAVAMNTPNGVIRFDRSALSPWIMHSRGYRAPAVDVGREWHLGLDDYPFTVISQEPPPVPGLGVLGISTGLRRPNLDELVRRSRT